MVVCPFASHVVREFGPETQMMDFVGEGMASRDGGIEVVIEVMYVHVSVAE